MLATKYVTNQFVQTNCDYTRRWRWRQSVFHTHLWHSPSQELKWHIQQRCHLDPKQRLWAAMKTLCLLSLFTRTDNKLNNWYAEYGELRNFASGIQIPKCESWINSAHKLVKTWFSLPILHVQRTQISVKKIPSLQSKKKISQSSWKHPAETWTWTMKWINFIMTNVRDNPRLNNIKYVHSRRLHGCKSTHWEMLMGNMHRLTFLMREKLHPRK